MSKETVITEKKTKVLVFDIETAPLLSYTWGIWQQNIGYDTQVERDWYMLCWAAKWLGEDKTIFSSLTSFPKTYEKDPEDDSKLVNELIKLLDQADVVITHNGDKFDIKAANARALINGIKPPSPFKSIDTLKIAKRHFKFTSNKLDSIASILGEGCKNSTGGFSLWKGCMQGDHESWGKMINYNIQDVDLLERIYLRLRPWATGLPPVSSFDEASCPCCGSTRVQKRGTYETKSYIKYQRYNCKDCGSWSRSRVNKASQERGNSPLPLRMADRK